MAHERTLRAILASELIVAAGACASSSTREIKEPIERLECTSAEREQTLRSWQAHVLSVAPMEVSSLEEAIEPGAPLAGWRLSHGYAVVAGSASVALDNIEAEPPTPPVLLYAPSGSSKEADWTDFDGPDGPYRLAGWAYAVPFESLSKRPQKACVAPNEWFVHEAGWHLMDGGMQLTPGATQPPPPPDAAGYFWHPRIWDIHVWLGADGIPTLAFENPSGDRGGVELPEGAFLRVVDGELEPITAP